MNAYEFTISLRIRHPGIDPSRITDVLGIVPQHTWKVGEPRRGPAGEDLGGVYRESYWMGRLMERPQLSSESTSVESQLMQVLTHLARSQPLLEEISDSGGVAELYVSLFARENFQLDLSLSVLALLSRLRLAVALEVQPHAPYETLASRGPKMTVS